MQTTGFGVIETDGHQHRYIDSGVIRTTTGQPLNKRLLIIYNDLASLLESHQPDQVAMESLFFYRNITSALKVAQAQGVFNLLCEQRQMPIIEYTPLQMKMTLTGYGRADKKQIQTMVQKFLKLAKPPRPVDCADALGIALTHSLSSPLKV